MLFWQEHVVKFGFYFPTRRQCKDIPLAYDCTANSRVHYYPLWSSTSSSQSTMYLIILLSVTLWCLFGGCYLFAVETPQGSIQPIRDCCSVNSPLTSSGWAWLLFKWVSFVLALSSNHRVTDSPGKGLMALLHTPRCTWWSLWSISSQRGVSVTSKERRKRRWRTDAVLSLAQIFGKLWRRFYDPSMPLKCTRNGLWEWNYQMVQLYFPPLSITRKIIFLLVYVLVTVC